MKRKVMFFGCVLWATGALAQQGDMAYVNQLPEVRVTARWKNDTDRYHYNQLKFYVTTVLPYVNAATALFNEVNAKEHDPNVSKKEYKRFVKSREHEMRDLFEDKIRSLNTTQGVLLVKLIGRQTNLNLYSMIHDVKNPMAAIKWQSWALLNGMNLDRKYRPEAETDLENVMLDLGYPLPASYAVN